MSLFHEAITAAVAERLERSLRLPTGLLHLAELHSRGGYAIYGFSLFSKTDPSLSVDLVVLAWDFVRDPSFQRSFDEMCGHAEQVTQLNLEGELHAVLDAHRQDDLGLLICVSEKQSNTFVKLLRTLRASFQGGEVEVPEFFHWQPGICYDQATNKVIGAATLDSCLRCFHAGQAFHEAWPRVFDTPCPTPLPIGLVDYKDRVPFWRPDGTQEWIEADRAFTHPDLRNAPKEWRRLGGLVLGLAENDVRLAEWIPDGLTREAPHAALDTFCRNVFGMIHVAHRFLNGSFTCAFGSALTVSNVGPRGDLYDLETFTSALPLQKDGRMIFGDIVREEDQIEDLVVGLELIALYCSRVGLDATATGVYRLAYETYTAKRAGWGADPLREVKDFARTMFCQAAWSERD